MNGPRNNQTRWRSLATSLAAALALSLGLGCSKPLQSKYSVDAQGVHTAIFYSPIFVVDRIWKSMQGPHDTQVLEFPEKGNHEVLWVTGIKTSIVDENDEKAAPQEFMCHLNVSVDILSHRQRFGWSKNVNERVFTLSQGGFEMAFPAGFAVPMWSDEEIKLTTQVLNLNHEKIREKVRHKVTVTYLRDSELKHPLTPLFWTAAFVMKGLDGTHAAYGYADTEANDHSSCLPGQHALGAKATGTMQDPLGHKYTGHWVVKPGRETTRSNVTRYLNIPFDTKLHFVAVHVHPFLESLELRDLTTGATLFKSLAQGPAQGVGLQHVDYFSSVGGVPVFAGHEYELTSVYNNTSATDQDAMATMFLYLEDKEFRSPRS